MNIGIGSIAGAIIGFFLTKGSIAGAVIGGFIGSMFDTANSPSGKNNKRRFSRSGPVNQHDFGRYLMMLSSVVIKADGKTMKSELNFVKSYFIKQFGEASTKTHVKNLKKYLETNISVEKVSWEIEKSLNGSSKILLLQYLIGIANADGEISESELQVIRKIAHSINIPKRTLDSILAMFFYQSGNYHNNYQEQTGQFNHGRIDASYKILGLSSSATNDEVKKAYRKLAIKYHPDKVAQLGPEFQKGATEKFQKVQDAYETIKTHKGIK